jgi:hypothetical protein
MRVRDHGDGDREPEAEKPRSEPEILPPQRGEGRHEGRRHVWVALDEAGNMRRVYVARPGPFAFILALILVGLVAAAILLLLLGAMLIAVPLLVAAVIAAVLSGTFRQFWRWLRAR